MAYGPPTPVWTYAEDVHVRRSTFSGGEQKLSPGTDRVLAVYVLGGNLEVNGEQLSEHEFFKLEDEEELSFECKEGTELFIVDVPKEPGYTTFLEERFGA
jgi:redox-sensitive bicupin YhaK (pirin superfamily)